MLHNFSKYLLVLFIAFITTSCLKVKKKENPQKPSEVLNQSVDPEIKSQQTDKALVVYLKNENSILTEIVWPKNWPDKVKLELADIKNKTTWNEIVSTKMNYQFFEKDPTGSIYKIKILTIENIQISELTVVTPLNLVVSEDTNLKKILHGVWPVDFIYIKNLEIGSNKRLFIEDFNGKIQIEQLVSNQGFITTFSEHQKSVWPDKARDVGRFQIIIEHGYGDLKFIIKAEDGAYGKNGAEPDVSKKGRTGQAGEPAQFERVNSQNCFRNPFCQLEVLYKCIKPGGFGGRGFKGQQGHYGENGMTGGSVFPFEVSNNSSDLKITISKMAGIGGQGGLGGPGGEGGDPGLGSDGGVNDLAVFLKLDLKNPQHQAQFRFMKVIEPCPAQGSYGPGDDGDTGPQGRPGANGVVY